jgi:hypothetical protein
VTTIKRCILVEKNLYFEYEVSPHRVILARISDVSTSCLRDVISPQDPSEQAYSKSKKFHIAPDGNNARPECISPSNRFA